MNFHCFSSLFLCSLQEEAKAAEEGAMHDDDACGEVVRILFLMSLFLLYIVDFVISLLYLHHV